MEKQEIDRLVAQCEEITDDFRSSLKPAVNKNRQVKRIEEEKEITLLEATGEEVQNYINNIQKILNNEALEAIKKDYPYAYNIIDCSYLYITEAIYIGKELPFCNFKKTTFSGGDDFSGATFSSGADFRGATFSYETNFTDTIFSDGANFNETVFSGEVTFSGATFSHITFFQYTTFSDKADFTDTTFSSAADFIDAKFLSEVYFEGSTFSDDVDFTRAIFSNWTGFSEVTFIDSTNFDSTIFFDANFSDTIFSKGVSFYNTIFKNNVYFNNSKLKDTTNFTNTTFTIPPIFHNAELHPDTSFGQPEDIARNFGRCQTQEDYMAYRTLKQHMSKVQARLEESMFFTLEQRTKRNIDGKDFLKNWSNYLISLFYDHISGYGQNTAKPIVILLISGLIVFPAIYWALDDILGRSIIVNVVKELKEQNLWGWYQSLPVHLGYSLQSIFNPLVFFNKDSAFIATNPLIRFISSIQSMFTIAVFALWLLAVRNRFQKGS